MAGTEMVARVYLWVPEMLFDKEQVSETQIVASIALVTWDVRVSDCISAEEMRPNQR